MPILQPPQHSSCMMGSRCLCREWVIIYTLRVLPADEPELESPYGGTPTATAHLLQSLKICICKETTGYPASQGGSGMSHVIQSDLEDVLVSVASATSLAVHSPPII